MRTVTKIEYQTPGLIVAEEGSIVVDHRDPHRALAQLPEAAYAFRFYTLTYLTAVSELGDSIELPPTRSNETGWYYPGGYLYDLAEVEALAEQEPDRYRILAANMRGQHEQVVRCRTGNWQPFEVGDELLEV